MTTANIVYATITGNNESVADIVNDRLSSRGIQVGETEISATDVDRFGQADILVVCVYTYDEGALPEEAEDFYDDLATVNFRGKVFGVAGSGDQSYGQYYDVAVDQFDAALAKTGARRGAAKVKINLEPYEEDIERLDRFAQSLVEATKQ